jgi:hypothetical protein
MSEELEWELYDIFASGIFAFPIYEHNSARRIVRYLLMRGVPAEDVAAAIEDHAVDLRSWLERRPGHHMVGEWVMAWLNDSRDQYKADRRDRRLVCRMRRNNCIAGNAYPAAYRERVAPPSGNFLEPFYGFPVRGHGELAFDEVSSTTASTTSSDSESDDGNGSSVVYRSRNASWPQRNLSMRSSSQGTLAASRYGQQLTPSSRQKHTFIMGGRSGSISAMGSYSASGQVVIERSDDINGSAELTTAGARNKSGSSSSRVAMLRRTTGSDGDLRRAESGDGIVKRWLGVALHRISRSCPHLIRPTICATPPRHIPETAETEADDWRQSYEPCAAQMSAVTPSCASSSSRFRNIRPPLLDIVITSGSTEFPVTDCQQRTAAALSSTSLTTAAAGASIGDHDSFPDPPDSGNVSDLQCNCSASVCCGGGVGYEHNCPSPVPSDPGMPPTAGDGRFPAASSSQQSLTNSGVADRQPVSMGSEAWCDCDRCLFALPHCIDHSVTAARWRHGTVAYASTSNLSTSSCCRRASIGGDREEVIDGRWPPSPPPTTIHDIFPVS